MPRASSRAGIEAAVGVEARIIDRLGHGPALAETVANAAAAMGRGIGLGRDAGRRLEQAVEVIGAQADRLGQRIEGRLFLRGFDQAAGRGHLLRLKLLQRRLVGLAALARAEARALGGRGAGKESAHSRGSAGARRKRAGNRRRCSPRRSRTCRRSSASRATTASQRASSRLRRVGVEASARIIGFISFKSRIARLEIRPSQFCCTPLLAFKFDSWRCAAPGP